MIENNFFKITPYENLIVAEFFGSWDKAVTKEYLEEGFNIIRQYYSHRPYAVLDDCRGWETNTPEATQFWKESFANANIPLPTHVAYIVGDSGLRSWVIDTMTKDSGPFEKAIFKGYHEGLKWLESNGYKASQPRP